METFVSEDGIYLVTAHAQTYAPGEHDISIYLEVFGGINSSGTHMTHFTTASSLYFDGRGTRCGANLAFEVPIPAGETVGAYARVKGTSESNVDVSLTVDWRAPCTIPGYGSG